MYVAMTYMWFTDVILYTDEISSPLTLLMGAYVLQAVNPNINKRQRAVNRVFDNTYTERGLITC